MPSKFFFCWQENITANRLFVCPKLKPLTDINELKIIIFVLNYLSVLVYKLKKKFIVMCLNNIFHPRK